MEQLVAFAQAAPGNLGIREARRPEGAASVEGNLGDPQYARIVHQLVKEIGLNSAA